MLRGWLALGYGLLLYGFIYLPVLVLVTFSFQSTTLPVPPFSGPSLRWYHAVWEDQRLLDALLNSVLVAAGSSLVALILGFLAAFGMARYRPAGERWLHALLMAPLTVSYLIIGMGLLITFNMLGIGKSLLAVGLGHVVINLPLCFAILYSQMGEQQANVERAARDLGAREWQVLWLVSIPMLWPALFAAFFLSVTFSWDEFLIAFLVSRFDVTLPVEIWSMLRSGLNPRTNAVGSVVFLISVAMALLMALSLGLRKRS